MPVRLPRLVIAGPSGESGKTLVSLGLLLLSRRAGLEVRAFKKGPDYIDAAWLSWASGSLARNLDTFLMGFECARASFAAHAAEGLNLVEGNRGLYDGLDPKGTHSTAELAKTLAAPVVLVLNITKVTRTAAAWVLGCQKLDPAVEIRGVILNRVAGTRHQQVARAAIEQSCGVPVLGAIPRAGGDTPLPWRHLGLVTPQEHPEVSGAARTILSLVDGHLEFERLLEVARSVPPLMAGPLPPEAADGTGLKIGYVLDSAFTFYYPENLEALARAGARLAPVSALSSASLPADLDALYVGGGFPETHAARLAANRGFLVSVRERALAGLPVYAECGGLMFLARAIWWKGEKHLMAGVLPFEVEVCPLMQGHGYACLTVDRANPFFAVGQTLRGHEFHYSRILPGEDRPATAFAVERGVGCYDGRDGVMVRNVLAAYTHLHALAETAWARGLLAAARARRDGR